jgi:hypothetical protein
MVVNYALGSQSLGEDALAGIQSTDEITGKAPAASGLSGDRDTDFEVVGRSNTTTDAKGNISGTTLGFFGDGPTASGLSGAIAVSYQVSGAAPAASNASANLDTEGEIDFAGSANTTSGLSAYLGADPRAFDGGLPTAAWLSGSLIVDEVFPLTGELGSASEALGSLTVIKDEGRTSAAAELSGVLGVSTGLASDASTSALMVGQLTGGVASKRWALRDPKTYDVYELEIGPSSEGSRGSQKNIAWSNSAASNKTLLYQLPRETATNSLQGTILSQSQYEELREWSKKRYALTLVDDLGRSSSIYIQMFNLERAQSPDQPYRTSYTFKYLTLG